jgi:branched-chain amino acid transport system permease protein
MPQLLKNKHVEKWTGGVQGIVIVKPDAPFGLKLTPDQWLYLFTLVITIVMFVSAGTCCAGESAAHWSRSATIDRGLGDGHRHRALQVARVRGQRDVHRHRRLARRDRGAVRRPRQLRGRAFDRPVDRHRDRRPRIDPGAFFGALFIQFIPNIADQISKAAPWAIYGIFLIGFMFLMPMGINGAIRLGWARFRHRSTSAQRQGG